MKQFDLGKYRKARVWLNELPDIDHSANVTQEAIKPMIHLPERTKKAAVEVFVPLGPRSMYGLLGGEFKSSTNQGFEITIIANTVDGKLLHASLAGVSEQVRVGLPKEYYKAVKEGVSVAQKIGGTISGELVINCAAYGELGSCPAVFKHLATVLMRLFKTREYIPSDEEIVSFFPHTFA